MAKMFLSRRARSSLRGRGSVDAKQFSFHFRPVRPADIVVSLDPVSSEVNLAAGTYGVAAWDPLTIGLHIHKLSYDSQRNVSAAPPGTELVIALPGRDLVRETWFTSNPIPRGINEGELGRLIMVPSRIVKPPSIAECPVNLETVIDRVDLYGIHHIVLCRVLGARVDDEFVTMDRLSTLRRYPTHECDDIENAWHGSVERLSLVGELMPCPQFPCGPRRGERGTFKEWLTDLERERVVSSANAALLQSWAKRWMEVATKPDAPGRNDLRAKLSRALELAAWEELDALNAFLQSNGAEVTP